MYSMHLCKSPYIMGESMAQIKFQIQKKISYLRGDIISYISVTSGASLVTGAGVPMACAPSTMALYKNHKPFGE